MQTWNWRTKSQGMKLQDMNRTDRTADHEKSGHEKCRTGKCKDKNYLLWIQANQFMPITYKFRPQIINWTRRDNIHKSRSHVRFRYIQVIPVLSSQTACSITAAGRSGRPNRRCTMSVTATLLWYVSFKLCFVFHDSLRVVEPATYYSYLTKDYCESHHWGLFEISHRTLRSEVRKHIFHYMKAGYKIQVFLVMRANKSGNISSACGTKRVKSW